MRGTGKENVILSMMDSCYIVENVFQNLLAQTSGASPVKDEIESMALHSSGNERFPSLKIVSLYRNGVIRQDRKAWCYFL